MRAALAAFALFAALGARAAETPPPPGSDLAVANLQYQQGVAFFRQRNWTQAEPLLRDAVRLNPKFGAAYFLLSVCDLTQKHDAQAVVDAQKGVDNTKDTAQLARLHFNISVAQSRLGRKDLADAEFKTAVALDPNPLRGAFSRPAPAGGPAVPVVNQSSWAPFLPILLVAVVLIPLAIFQNFKNKADVPALGADRAAYALERELRDSPLPRRVVARNPAQAAFPVVILLVYMVPILSAGHAWDLTRAEFVRRVGVPGTATVDSIYQVRTGKHGTGRETHLVLAYRDGDGPDLSANALVGGRRTDGGGSTVDIRYWPGHPGWAAVDDDRGLARSALQSGGIVLSFALLVIGAVTWAVWRDRALVATGTPVPAKVTDLGSVYKGTRKVTISYQSAGASYTAKVSVPDRIGLRQDEIVTALIDPRKPSRAIVYRGCTWKAAFD